MTEKGSGKQQNRGNDRRSQEGINPWKKTVLVRDVLKPSHGVDRTQGATILGPAKVAAHGRPATGGCNDHAPAGHAQPPGKVTAQGLWIWRKIGHRWRNFVEADVTFPSLQAARLISTFSLALP
jgi:hypothetical protein